MADLNENLAQLKIWRESNDRKSREILDIWDTSLSQNVQKLGKEKHLILEQVCIAGLDCFQMGTVHRCIEELYKDFPKSLRVKKYEAMYLEAEGKYDDALIVLEGIIKVDEMNSAAMKRKIAILKAQNRIPEAIKELAEYLKTFMADVEAWQELSELYISEQDFSKAAFCIEELILHNPHNHLLHQRYADIKYTQGGMDNIDVAKAYYCQAIKLNPKNMRALYGLYLAATALAMSSKCAAQKKKEAGKLVDWVLAEIESQYRGAKATNLEIQLNALQIN